MKRKLSALLSLILILCLLLPSGLAARYGDVVRITNRNAVNVRKGPGTGYGVIGEAQPENVYPWLGTENGWHRIIFTGDVEGYVSASLTTLETGLVPDDVGGGEQVEAIVRVTHYNSLNVRKGPGTKYGAIGEARPDSTWTYLGTDDGWNIIDYNGRTGYIAANRTEVEVVDVIAGATGGSEPCYDCGGSGECTTCDGLGVVYSRKTGYNIDCPTCDGEEICWTCGGDGLY